MAVWSVKGARKPSDEVSGSSLMQCWRSSRRDVRCFSTTVASVTGDKTNAGSLLLPMLGAREGSTDVLMLMLSEFTKDTVRGYR